MKHKDKLSVVGIPVAISRDVKRGTWRHRNPIANVALTLLLKVQVLTNLPIVKAV